MEWVNMLVELIGLLAFLRSSGRTAHPLVGTAPTEQGMTFWRFMFGGGLIVPWLIQTLLLLGYHSRKTAASQKQKGGVGLVVSALVLVGGYFLRRTVINAGYVSSKDARTTLWNTR
jgi:formate-dependent nitrite reductase membrane component NrfD